MLNVTRANKKIIIQTSILTSQNTIGTLGNLYVND